MSVFINTPCTLLATLNVQSDATVSSAIHATARVKAGFQISSASGVQQIADSSLKSDGSGLEVTGLCSGTASAAIGIMPVAQVVLDYLGGPVSVVTSCVVELFVNIII